jgi:hypothetical protein
MKKILLASSLALSALIIAPPAVAVEIDITPSGFVDFVWTLSDGTDVGKYGEEGQFFTFGELDIESKLNEGVSIRVDVDVNPSTGAGDSARLEQIFLKWDFDPKMSLMGGVFNNKLTFEREDSPEMYQLTHGQLWDIWGTATEESDNNLQGLEFNYQFDKVNLILGYLNDLGDIPEKNSVEVAAEIKPVKDLNITLGLITQDQSLETIFDIFASYKMKKWLFAGEILVADKQVDNGLMLMTNFQFNDKVSATARYDLVSYESTFLTDDTSSLTIAGLYSFTKNLIARAEIRFNDDNNQAAATKPIYGEGDGTTARLGLLATF